MLSAAFIFALSLAGQARAQAACSSFAVPELPGVVFQEALDADFTKLLPTQDVAEALSNMNLSISNFNVGSTPVVHTFFPSNVAIGNNGSLELTVKSYAGSGPVSSAEISTTAEFTYCSARTVMKTSSVPGVCVGSFFYQSDVSLLCSSSRNRLYLTLFLFSNKKLTGKYCQALRQKATNTWMPESGRQIRPYKQVLLSPTPLFH